MMMKVNLGFSQESSGYVIYLPLMKEVITTNQVDLMQAIFHIGKNQSSMSMSEYDSRTNYESILQ